MTILGLLFSAVIVALLLLDFWTRYREAIASARTDTLNLAAILAEHAAVTFEDIDRVLLEAEAIRKEKLSGKYASPAAVNAALHQLVKRSSVLVAVGWTDASGEVVAHSYDHLPARSNISDMSHFIVHRDSAAGGLFVAPPYRSAVTDKWFSAASRRLSNPDGSFAGVVSAALDQSYLLKIYRTLDLGGDGSVVLFHRNGRILARVPEQKDVLGMSVAGGPLFTRLLPASDAGNYEVTSPVDGVARIAGYKAVSGLPLVMAVTYARNHVLQQWYRHLYVFGPLAAAIVVVILLGTWLLRRQTNTLAETNARFDAALSNMPHGLSMFDADENLLIANSRYRDMYQLTEAQVRRGTPLRDIVRDYNVAKGDLDIEEFLDGAKRRTPRIITLADGRIIAIQRTPMQNGGWVATHQDITEKRRDEALLAEHAAELKLINTRFDVAISNMSQGLCLFDADKNLVISNSRYQQMYDLPDELVRPGTSLQRILQHYADRGEDDLNLSVNQHLQKMRDQRLQDYQLKNSRQILIQRKSLPDGGWVATHEDVTEQRRGEQMLAEKAGELEAINLRFDAALNNMSQGLCLFDADQRVVVSNARYAEIYHLGHDRIRPGTSLAQILEYRREQGTHFADVAADVYRKHNVKQLNEIRELADGRVIAIARHMMPGGGWLTTHEDITDRAKNEKRIAFLAQHDLLTGLANRAVFSEKLDEAAKRLQRHGTTFTVLMLDLDRFKAVNDTLGHAAGDQLLIEVAQRLQSSLRDTDVLARLGGDEFAIIQENEKNQSEGAIGLALRIIGLIEQPFDLGGNRASVGTSIGIAFAPEHGTDAESLLKKADVALYAAKSGGRNDFRVFDRGMTESADTKKSMDVELRQAMACDEFELHYQPVIDARTRAISGLEAFVRWHHPSKGMLVPEQFLATAESAGLMQPLGEWILRQACLDAAAWRHVKVAVNVSAAQLHKANFFDVVLCALVETGLSPERLELEVSAAALLDKNSATQLSVMRQLKNLGVSIVLDDCSMGYSAASFLQGFPFDKIKIDRSIVQGCTTRKDCAAAVASAIALAKGLEIATVAKGVESREQFETLLMAGVDFVQGYLLGRPVPGADVDFDKTISVTQNVA